MAAAAVATLSSVNPASRGHSRVDKPGGSAFPTDEQVCLRRVGLNFDPPSLVLEYERSSTGRLFHRRIGIRRLGPRSNPTRTAEKLRRENEALLAEDQVPFEQLVSLVTRLQSKVAAKLNITTLPTVTEPPTTGEALRAPATTSTAELTSSGQATKADPAEPEGPAQAASGDSGSPSTAASTSAFAPPLRTSPASDEPPLRSALTSESRGAELSETPICGELDLNKLSDEELKKHKAQMDVEFFKNQKKPGDPGFVYDVRVEFDAGENAASCGWDSDED